MRRYLKPLIVLAVLGLAFGGLYRYLFDHVEEREFANFVRSSLHGAGVLLAAGMVQLYFTSRASAWVRRWPLVVELVIRSLAMALAVAAVIVALEAILYPYGVERQWLAGDFRFIVAISFAGSILIGAIYELIRLVGGRVLINVLVGRYRRPVREQRVLLFLDLAGSTTLAEQMGELRVQDLLTRFFYDIDEAIVSHGGEVHAYVGDEVIVTWPVGAKLSRSYIDCFLAIEDCVAALTDRYKAEFGLVPEFRAGIHAGPVVISECGDSHRQVAYFGDTMNVAARLQAHCKQANRRLLVSGELVRLLPEATDFRVEPLGPTELRGRAAPVEVFAVARQAPLHSANALEGADQ
jgi:class 3 adenylate cyclase